MYVCMYVRLWVCENTCSAFPRSSFVSWDCGNLLAGRSKWSSGDSHQSAMYTSRFAAAIAVYMPWTWGHCNHPMTITINDRCHQSLSTIAGSSTWNASCASMYQRAVGTRQGGSRSHGVRTGAKEEYRLERVHSLQTLAELMAAPHSRAAITSGALNSRT